MTRITEQASKYRHLEKMSVSELTSHINNEDKIVAQAIEKALPRINELIENIIAKISKGGRLFYVGAGSGGRLSVLDCIELPTTFGIQKGVFNVVLAGGLEHLIEAPEEKEDDVEAAWEELQKQGVSGADIVVGISASGTTPYVLSALKSCKKNAITTACIVSNPASPIAAEADIPVEVITGPEFVSGSTRMKCGTAQKMIFDMISTTTMTKLGHVLDNQMVNVKLINDKITDRAVKMLMSNTGSSDYNSAKAMLLESGSVKKALDTLAITHQSTKP
ncbi:N-acetylmuramic acid 6-phosphate etherase [Daejeonella lutea]|uniref:N-acetylmuramic acid 6-phosphate etherase n=1 Tax=Daejeonella lutea TaxID=572036 RepID=A0A1T5A771_9SPHI|nr:N-acetylmuramic acid 6-phosphate etherase [Daejeonella lutea]SKB30780.1 N-acetylmuramic acid 6-phosphate etherase [Daejeonella lutea]